MHTQYIGKTWGYFKTIDLGGVRIIIDMYNGRRFPTCDMMYYDCCYLALEGPEDARTNDPAELPDDAVITECYGVF